MTNRILHCPACTLTLANAVAENGADAANCPRCHAKLLSLAVLIQAARTRATARRRGLTKLYAFVKFIGRWSMLDVFLVAFLTGAVQFGALASVRPEPGLGAFAAAVVLTIFATESFDSRLLWDHDDAPEPSPP